MISSARLAAAWTCTHSPNKGLQVPSILHSDYIRYYVATLVRTSHLSSPPRAFHAVNSTTYIIWST